VQVTAFQRDERSQMNSDPPRILRTKKKRDVSVSLELEHLGQSMISNQSLVGWSPSTTISCRSEEIKVFEAVLEIYLSP